MAAAYLFEDMEMFIKSTLFLILNYEGFYPEFLENDMINQGRAYRTFCEYRPYLSAIGWASYFLDLLEERRNQMRAEVCELLI